MASTALEANLHTSGKIVNYSNAFFFGGKLAYVGQKLSITLTHPQTIGELKAAITGKIIEIPKEECVRVIDNFARRMQVLPPTLWRPFGTYFGKNMTFYAKGHQ